MPQHIHLAVLFFSVLRFESRVSRRLGERSTTELRLRLRNHEKEHFPVLAASLAGGVIEESKQFPVAETGLAGTSLLASSEGGKQAIRVVRVACSVGQILCVDSPLLCSRPQRLSYEVRFLSLQHSEGLG